MRARSLFRVAGWGGAFALYLLLSGQVSTSEALTGAGIMIVTALWSARLRAVSQHRFEGGWADAACWARAWAGLPAATARMASTLLLRVFQRGAPSRARPHAFEYGREDDPREQARRANAVLAASLSPPRFVVTLPEDHARVLLHELAAPAHPLDPRWLA